VAFLDAAPAAGASAGPRALVAKEAVRNDGGASFVFVVKDGRLERRAVTAGAGVGADTPILAGLSGGETVVLKGPAGLADGQRVRVKTQ
jgi:HlyD family secretion protein